MSRAGGLLVAQGGGPTVVINASLFGLVSRSIRELDASVPIWGATGGIVGVLKQRWLDLRKPTALFWREVVRSPGAALGSCRKMLTTEEATEAVRVLQKREIRYFFYIGGNDSMDTVLKMSEAASTLHYEIACCGIPKTIDNDLPETDHCPGFGSAARYIAQSTLDLGADIYSLPTPVSILEVMGRDAGWLTAATSLARKHPNDAPHLIYVPEVPLSSSRFLEDVQRIYDRQGWVVAAVSEGVKDESGRSWAADQDQNTIDGFGHQLPGDVANRLAKLVTSRLKLRARSEKPGLLGRSCALMASPVDRSEARQVGSFGFGWSQKGNTGFMVSLVRDDRREYRVSYLAVPLNTVANRTRLLPTKYVSASGNDIDESYRAYVEPLIGKPLQRYTAFDRTWVQPGSTMRAAPKIGRIRVP